MQLSYSEVFPIFDGQAQGNSKRFKIMEWLKWMCMQEKASLSSQPDKKHNYIHSEQKTKSNYLLSRCFHVLFFLPFCYNTSNAKVDP